MTRYTISSKDFFLTERGSMFLQVQPPQEGKAGTLLTAQGSAEVGGVTLPVDPTEMYPELKGQLFLLVSGSLTVGFDLLNDPLRSSGANPPAMAMGRFASEWSDMGFVSKALTLTREPLSWDELSLDLLVKHLLDCEIVWSAPMVMTLLVGNDALHYLMREALYSKFEISRIVKAILALDIEFRTVMSLPHLYAWIVSDRSRVDEGLGACDTEFTAAIKAFEAAVYDITRRQRLLRDEERNHLRLQDSIFKKAP